MTICKNCTQEFEGKFCPKCGQKAKTGRITIRQVLNDARQHFIHFDQGFLYTMRELITRPGHSIREYIDGRRVKHIKPVKFMFWAAAINFLILHFIGLDREIIQKMAEQQPKNNAKANELGQKFGSFLMEHPSIMLFCMIPAIALCSWLLFRRRNYNYAEHFVLNAFLMGEVCIASVLTVPVSKFLNDVSSSTAPVTLFGIGIWVVYFGWSYTQFFPSQKKFWVFFKGGLSIFLGYLMMILFIGIAVILLVVIFRSQIEQWMAS